MTEQNSKPQWTPRPWAVYASENCDVVTEDRKLEIASTHPSVLCGGTPAPECKANAHLIAAAPELYEALERLLALEETDPSPSVLAIQQARTVLAKARGETE